ncbi:MAG: hypothetical protein IPK81_10955 [Rhodospirillales bacterium]|nr:MAG: hypothetical protein IPK81_10955 [Rhodospirillales bacterium]
MSGPRPTLRRRGVARLLGALAAAPLAGTAAAADPPRRSPARPAAAAVTRFIPLDSAPFPYRGRDEELRRPFFDVAGPGRRLGRTLRGGEVVWEDQAYRDPRAFLHAPASFDPSRPATIVAFFHGHGTMIEKAAAEYELARQIDASGLNAVLFAPQFARDAADSTPGKFQRPGAFARFIDEAGLRLAAAAAPAGPARASWQGAMRTAKVVVVAFSGGYKPAAWVAERGGVGRRLVGMVLLDALYDDEDRFTTWFTAARHRGFLVSLYTEATAASNAALMERLGARRIAFGRSLPAAIGAGTAAFVPLGASELHARMPIDGPPREPVRAILAATRPRPARG